MSVHPPLNVNEEASTELQDGKGRGLLDGPWTLPLVLFAAGCVAQLSYLSTVPPGINGDAARLGLYAQDLLERGLFPFYIYHQFGPYPLIVYLQAAVFAIFGYGLPALRGVTAFVAGLQVPLAYLACRELFADRDPAFGRWAGVFAGLGLALSPFVGHHARIGIEGPLLPLTELLVVLFLWRGWRQGQRRDFILAGFMLGLSQYTYIVGRFFPLALAGGVGVALLLRPQLRTTWRGLAWLALSAALVALPQWVLFIDAPYTFAARTQQSAGRFLFSVPDPVPMLLAKLANQLLMLGWRWDNAYNPASGRPWLNPVLLFGFLIALFTVLRWRRASASFVLACGVLMLLPDLIFYESVVPSATRLVGAVPFFFILAGAGLAELSAWLTPRLPARVPAAGPFVLAALLLVGVEGQWDYSRRVLPEAAAISGLEWRESLVEIAEAVHIADHAGEPILLPAAEYERAPLGFLVAAHFPERVGVLDVPLSPGQAVRVLVPTDPDRPTTEGIPSGYRLDEWVLLKDRTAYFLPPLSGAVNPASDGEPITAANGVLAASSYTTTWQASAAEMKPFSASFEDGLDLIGYRTSSFEPGQPLHTTLFWRPRHAISDTQVFCQILDRSDNAVAIAHEWPLHGAYRVAAWRAGEAVPIGCDLQVPADLPPGVYRLVTGTVDLLHQSRNQVLSGGEYAVLSTFKVSPPPSTFTPERTIDAIFGSATESDPLIRLPGYTMARSADKLRVVLFWQVERVTPHDYTVFVHIIDSQGNMIAQADSQPLGGNYPTSAWSVGETIVDEYVLSVPPGDHRVAVGLYLLETGRRLPVTVDGVAQPDNALPLADGQSSPSP